MIVLRTSTAVLTPIVLKGRAEVNHERSAGIMLSWVLWESSSSSELSSCWEQVYLPPNII